MTPSLLALLSIAFGIIGTNLFAVFYKKYSFDFIGNTILGVFGSIFFVKMLGRFGFSINDVIHSQYLGLLFTLNVCISILGGIIFLIFLNKMVKKS